MTEYIDIKDGIAIALAWPATFCKQAGSWYDPLMKVLGFNKNGYYRAGHAAVVLIKKDGICQYFDFGRYHAAFGKGRVRSSMTDPELKINTVPRFRNGNLSNLNQILQELSERSACHGTGDLHGSVVQVNYQRSYDKAKQLRRLSPLPYGPFIRGGTNCSRFVRAIILAGNLNVWIKLKLLFPYTITPSPMTVVRVLKKRVVIHAKKQNNQPPTHIDLDHVLPKPIRPLQVPGSAVWMAGEGAGSWFDIRQVDALFKVTRYAPDGTTEFEAYYKTFGVSKEPDLTQKFQVMPESHYLRIAVVQGESIRILRKTENREMLYPKPKSQSAHHLEFR
ncbi:MAG: DUF6695 family protein [Cyclobacteriaceae bacterium]